MANSCVTYITVSVDEVIQKVKDGKQAHSDLVQYLNEDHGLTIIEATEYLRNLRELEHKIELIPDSPTLCYSVVPEQTKTTDDKQSNTSSVYLQEKRNLEQSQKVIDRNQCSKCHKHFDEHYQNWYNWTKRGYALYTKKYNTGVPRICIDCYLQWKRQVTAKKEKKRLRKLQRIQANKGPVVTEQ